MVVLAAGLVDEDQALGIEAGPDLPPGGARGGHLRAVLLRRAALSPLSSRRRRSFTTQDGLTISRSAASRALAPLSQAASPRPRNSGRQV